MYKLHTSNYYNKYQAGQNQPTQPKTKKLMKPTQPNEPKMRTKLWKAKYDKISHHMC